jgi:hypothetical protein
MASKRTLKRRELKRLHAKNLLIAAAFLFVERVTQDRELPLTYRPVVIKNDIRRFLEKA